MSLVQMKIDLEGIGHLLGDQYLSVPAYQRAYAWETGHVDDLIDDIRASIQEGHSEYFLGAVVLSERSDGALDVVDGQQRLATTAILISAIRDWLIDNGDPDRADDIQRDFLVVRDRRSQEVRSKFTLANADHRFFYEHVINRFDIETSRPSHERIESAARTARKRVDRVADASANAIEVLLNWVEYIENNAKVIAVHVPSHANAFMVFETLNDRGLGLSAADLLKNYLFMLAEDRVQEVQENWVRMLGALESVADEGTVVSYIRHYWLSSMGHARARDLYKTIKPAITSKQRAVEFSDGIREGSRAYSALLNPSHDLWEELGGTGRDHLRTLQFLRMEQNRPLLLAVLQRFDRKEALIALKNVVSWSVRFLIVGGLGGGTMEKHYGERAREVRNGDIKTAGQLSQSMLSVVPSDEQFKASFSTARVSQAWLARYYFRALGFVRKVRCANFPYVAAA